MNSKVYKEASIFYNMKYLSLFILLLLFVPMLNAQESLGVIKQNECIRLYQTCPSCSYINISSVIYPDKTVANSSIALTTDDNFEYYADFCSTSQLGKYIVNGKGDVDGVDTAFAYDFEVTPSGFAATLGFYIVLLCIISGIVLLGFSIKEEWFVVLGGMGFIMLGIYSINYGVVGFRDMFMTWGVGLFEIAVGSILSIGAAWQKIDGD